MEIHPSSSLAAPPPEEVAPGLFRVPIAIPVPLRFVNSYLIRGSWGWTVVDTGFHIEPSERRWHEVFARLGIRASDIEQIVVTHYHPDHFGCAGWLQRLSGAPVLMLEQERPQVDRFWAPSSEAGEEIAAMFDRHGMPPEVTAIIPGHFRQQVERVQPLPHVRWLQPGDVVVAGRRRFEAIWAPGHAEGLMVLWEPQERLLIADDLILATITPNVSLWGEDGSNPLEQFLASLREVARLPARLVLPGHRDPVYDLRQRSAELMDHHRERLRRVAAIVEDATRQGALPPTAWEVNLRLFGRLEDPFSIRFAMGESLAHLEFLVQAGQLRRLDGGNRVLYATCSP